MIKRGERLLILLGSNCQRNHSVREDRVSSQKKHEKCWFFMNFTTLTQKKFWQKNEPFLKLTKVINEVTRDVIKPYKCVFALFWLPCFLDFIILSVFPNLNVEKELIFSKIQKKIQKTQNQKNVRAFPKITSPNVSMCRIATRMDAIWVGSSKSFKSITVAAGILWKVTFKSQVFALVRPFFE